MSVLLMHYTYLYYDNDISANHFKVFLSTQDLLKTYV